MFRYEILAMFENGNAVYNDFTKALLSHRMEDLNDILLDIAYTSMSYFDVGKCPPERTSENFYRVRTHRISAGSIPDRIKQGKRTGEV